MTGAALCSLRTLRPLLERHGFRLSHSLGQNFLIDSTVPERIAQAASLTPDTGVLEVGPGVGALTDRLCTYAGQVTALELDRRLFPVLAETVGDRENLTLRQGDVLKTDLRALVEETLPCPHRVAAANLPYYITTPAITALLSCRCFERIVIMVQREVADRLCAAPGGKDYGAFTLFVQYRAAAQTLFQVLPESFLPAPKVTSAVVCLTPYAAPPVSCGDPALLERVIRASFAQRRKTLLNGLSAGFPALSRETLRSCLAAAGLAEGVRGERLSLSDFARLSDQIGMRL